MKRATWTVAHDEDGEQVHLMKGGPVGSSVRWAWQAVKPYPPGSLLPLSYDPRTGPPMLVDVGTTRTRLGAMRRARSRLEAWRW